MRKSGKFFQGSSLGFLFKVILVFGLGLDLFAAIIQTTKYGTLDNMYFIDGNDILTLSKSFNKTININNKEYIFVVLRDQKKGFLLLSDNNRQKTKLIEAIPLKLKKGSSVDYIEDSSYKTIKANTTKFSFTVNDLNDIYSDHVTIYNPSNNKRWLVVIQKTGSIGRTETLFVENYPEITPNDDSFWAHLYYRKVVEENILYLGTLATMHIKAAGETLITTIDATDNITHLFNLAGTIYSFKNGRVAGAKAIDFFEDEMAIDQIDKLTKDSNIPADLTAKAIESVIGGFSTALSKPNLYSTTVSITGSVIKSLAASVTIGETEYYSRKLNNLLVARKLAYWKYYMKYSDDEIFTHYGLWINTDSWEDVANAIANELNLYDYNGICANPMFSGLGCEIYKYKYASDIEPDIVVNLYNDYRDDFASWVQKFKAVKNQLPQDIDGDGVSNIEEVANGTDPNTPDAQSATNDRPKASFTFDKTSAKVGETITATSTSTDTDGDPLTYTWTLFKPRGSSATLSYNGDKSKAYFTPDKVGSYTLALNVSDGKLYHNTMHKILVTSLDAPAGTVTSNNQWLLGSSNSWASGSKGWNKGLHSSDGWCVNVGSSKNNGCHNIGSGVESITLQLVDYTYDNALDIVASRNSTPEIFTTDGGSKVWNGSSVDYTADGGYRSSETLTVDSPREGTYYFAAYAFESFSKAKIFFSYKTNDDIDNDGVANEYDAFPNDPTKQYDTDGDGVDDKTDAFPNDPAASIDSDSDGCPDKWNDGYGASDSTTGLKIDQYLNDKSKCKDDKTDTIDLSKGLVAHYEFEGDAKDSSGNENDGTEHGGVEYVDGVIGKAAKFNGVDDYIKVEDSDSLKFQEISISAWVKIVSKTNTTQRIVTKWTTGSTDSNLQDFVFSYGGTSGTQGENKYQFALGKQTVNFIDKESIANGEWHLTTATYDGQASKLYLDGIELDEKEKDIIFPNGTAPMYIAGGGSSSSMPIYIFKGLIDDLRIYNRALNEQEIKALYDLGKQNTTTPTTLTENFSNGLSNWSIENNDDIPGSVEIVDGKLKLTRTNAGGNGGGVGIKQDVDIDVTDDTTISFDAKAASRSVGDGCGWTCQEYPVNIQLELENGSGNTYILKYSANYGGKEKNITKTNLSSDTYGTYDFKQVAVDIPQNKWTHLSFNIKKAFSDATKIKSVYIYGNGWNFESSIDNIKITESSYNSNTTPPTNETTRAQNHLSKYGVSMKTAEDFLMSNLSNLKFIHDVCKKFEVDNDMIAEVLADQFPGVTGRDVANYFAMNGIDATDLGGSTPTIQVKVPESTGSIYQGNYNGSFNGHRSGTWNVTISSNGTITGSAIDDQGYNYSLQGHMNGNQMVISDTNNYITFTGTITSSGNVSGSWKTGLGNTGTFTGNR